MSVKVLPAGGDGDSSPQGGVSEGKKGLVGNKTALPGWGQRQQPLAANLTITLLSIVPKINWVQKEEATEHLWLKITLCYKSLHFRSRHFMETTGACSGNYGPVFPYHGRAAASLSQHSSPTSVLTHTHQPEVQVMLWRELV